MTTHPGPTFKQAMANVRSDAKTDKRLARQLETMKKWKTARKDAQREARCVLGIDAMHRRGHIPADGQSASPIRFGPPHCIG